MLKYVKFIKSESRDKYICNIKQRLLYVRLTLRHEYKIVFEIRENS